MWRESWDQWQYLALMAACLLVTLPLELVLRARVYARARQLVTALIPVVLIYSAWDVVGIVRHHWSYSARYVSGIRLPLDMPLEELVFFVVVPICGLLTYEAVGTVLATGRRILRNRRTRGESRA